MTASPKMTPAARREYERTVLPLVDMLRRKALPLTRNASDADDLVQDTLVRAFRHWHTYDAERATARAWLSTVLRNTFRNRCEALNSRRNREHAAGVQGADCMGTVPAADAATDAADMAALVRGAVDALPADYAAVVRAVDLQGLAYGEAAAALGVPMGTVMSRLSRARKRLAASLAVAA